MKGARPTAPSPAAPAPAATTQPRIWVDHLSKRLGATEAVADLSLTVAEGELFGFLGPNGAGKTTTIKLLCALLRPTAGRALVNGFDVVHQPAQVRRTIGLVFQEATLDLWLTAWENLELHARIYHLPRADWQERAERLLRAVGLWERRHEPTRSFSGGMRRCVEVVRGLLHRPEALFLDEPTSGLDPRTREQIWRALLALRDQTGVTLFLTTHYLEEAERCDRVAIMDRGRIVALDTPDNLRALAGADVIIIETPDAGRAAANLRDRFGLCLTVAGERRLRVEATDGPRLLPRLVTGLGVPVEAVTLRRPTLDDAFRALTDAAPGAGGARAALPATVAGGGRPPPAARRREPGAPVAAAADLESLAALWRRDVLHFWRDRGQLAGSLGQALLVLVVVGQGFGGARDGGGIGLADLSYQQFIFPGVVVAIVLASAVASVISVVWDREFGPLKEVLVAPVPRWAIAAGKVLSASTTAMVPGVVMLVGAPIAGVGLGPLAALTLLPAVFLVAAATSALGLLIATRMRTMESFQVVVGLVLMPLVLLSGALVPFGDLPDWLLVATWLDPLSYGVDAIRQLVLPQAGAPPDVIERLGLRPFDHPLSAAADLAVVAASAVAMTAWAAASLGRRE